MKDILLLQTGGTISMGGAGKARQLESDEWLEVLDEQIPALNKVANIEAIRLFAEDSSDINRTHWKQISEVIGRYYSEYDGFVILHGTDTMAYTASALSFSLRNLSKPVILTGSQVPMTNIRSDARRNLINAIEMATHPLAEVAVCFNDHVFRGNRTTKMSIGDFDAFASPNYPPLAEIGLHIELGNNRLPARNEELEISPRFDDRLLLLKAYPNINTAYLNPDWNQLRALVLEAFGSGNFPIREPGGLLPLLETCRDRDIVCIIISQAPYDSVDLTKYESGQQALDLGAVGAGDMTVEAAVTKLMWLLGHYKDSNPVKNRFRESLAGEITL